MRVWATANQKGGVGKTTTVVGLGGLLAEAGHRVLLVDLDPHGSLTSYFGANPDEIEFSTYNFFQHNGDIPADLPNQIRLKTKNRGLDLWPASTLLATVERRMSTKSGMGLVVSKALIQQWDDYDYVLIDTPPILGILMVNALAACQRILLPVQTEHLAIKGLERMMRTLSMVMRSQGRDLDYIVVPTMFDRRTHSSMQSLRILRNTHEDCIWSSAIPIDTKLRDASKAGVPPSVYDRNSRAVKAYGSLLKYLLQHDIEPVHPQIS
ncbi:MAG: ParA family protein [Pseudomonadales bacterium]|nr:ParA family protein [Pseudomonadales bacterium]